MKSALKNKQLLLTAAAVFLAVSVGFGLAFEALSNSGGSENQNFAPLSTLSEINVLEIQPVRHVTTEPQLNKDLIREWGINLPDDKIHITTMSTYEFVGRKECLQENYHLIYIGADTDELNKNNPSSLIYYEVDGVLSGNNITKRKQDELEAYIAAGFPVIIDEALIEEIEDGEDGVRPITYTATARDNPNRPSSLTGNLSLRVNIIESRHNDDVTDNGDFTFQWQRQNMNDSQQPVGNFADVTNDDTSKQATLYKENVNISGFYKCVITYKAGTPEQQVFESNVMSWVVTYRPGFANNTFDPGTFTVVTDIGNRLGTSGVPTLNILSDGRFTITINLGHTLNSGGNTTTIRRTIELFNNPPGPSGNDLFGGLDSRNFTENFGGNPHTITSMFPFPGPGEYFLRFSLYRAGSGNTLINIVAQGIVTFDRVIDRSTATPSLIGGGSNSITINYTYDIVHEIIRKIDAAKVSDNMLRFLSDNYEEVFIVEDNILIRKKPNVFATGDTSTDTVKFQGFGDPCCESPVPSTPKGRIRILYVTPNPDSLDLTDLENVMEEPVFKATDIKIEFEIININSILGIDRSSFDVLVLGFAPVFSGFNPNIVAKIESFIADDERSVIFTNDTLDPDKNPEGEAIKWSFIARQFSNYDLKRKTPLPNIHNTTSYSSNPNNRTAKFVTRLNPGNITEFPFPIDETLSISGSVEPPFRLNMNDPAITVWYCLSSSYYLHNDAANAYYLYSRDNIFYSGIGLSVPITEGEAKLFINTIVAAYRSVGSQPIIAVEISNVFLLANSDGGEILHVNIPTVNFSIDDGGLPIDSITVTFPGGSLNVLKDNRSFNISDEMIDILKTNNSLKLTITASNAAGESNPKTITVWKIGLLDLR